MATRGGQYTRARNAVKEAVSLGVLPPASELTCVTCGKSAQVYHHSNGYDELHTYDVDALCRSCHALIHALDETPAAKASRIAKLKLTWAAKRAALAIRKRVYPELYARPKPITAAQTRREIRAKQIVEVDRLHAAGVSQVEIGRRLGLHVSTVSRIVNRKREYHAHES